MLILSCWRSENLCGSSSQNIIGSERVILIRSFFILKLRLAGKKNRIDRLKDINSNWCTWDGGLEDLMLQYFDELFTSSNGMVEGVNKYIKQYTTDKLNNILSQNNNKT